MTRFRIDPGRSRVWIDARSNVHPIHTEAGGLQGWLELDVSDGQINLGKPQSGRLEFPVVSLTSGNRLEDRELHRRIDARRYTTITGDMKEIKAGGEQTPHLVSGDLTFRGVTRTYEHEMTFEGLDGDTVKVSGESTFDIRDFGMEPPRILLLKVQPDVTVRVEIVAEKES